MLKKLLILTVALVGLCVWGNEAFAEETDPQVGTQAKGTFFRAVVLDSLTKEPIEFATLHAKYIGDKTPRKYALTDEKGVVVLQGMPIGRATITFEYMGYKSKHFTFDIKNHLFSVHFESVVLRRTFYERFQQQVNFTELSRTT